jgi:threonine synthase
MRLTCPACGGSFEVGPLFGCPTCGGALEFATSGRVDLAAALREGPGRRGPDDPGIWRWRAALPSLGVELTLGEGATPLLPGPGGLLLKYEGTNPTGSFKDRFQAVSMSAAKALGFGRAFCASTGNHGLAAATYARLAGLECLVLLHEESPPAFEDAVAAVGATVGRVPAGERDGLMRALLADAWFPATCLAPLPVPNPFGAEGYKTIAYEIVEQLGGAAPDAVVVPVGAGDGLYGVAKGFLEMAELGLVAAAPAVFGVQPEGADPLARAVGAGADAVEPLVEVAASPALSIREAATGSHALRLVRQSGGGAVTVSDDAILRAAASLAERGLIVDVASAAAVAGAARLGDRGTVVALLTAAGARWPRPPGYPTAGRVVRGSAADVRRLAG